jgi:hypothetical protein
MAVNVSDKKSLLKKMVPEIDFSISSSGLTLRSKRFNTPRFVPYEATGKCKECRSDTVELDFVISQQGVTLFCSRIKGEQFVKFDKTNELPGFCFFKLRSRGRVFNLLHGDPEAADKDQTTIQEYMRPQQPTKVKKEEEEEAAIIDLTNSGPPSPIESIDEAMGKEAVDASLNVQRFFDSLSAATKFLDTGISSAPTVHSVDSILSSSSSSSIGTQDEIPTEEEPIIRMGKMPWEEEETLASILAKKPRWEEEEDKAAAALLALSQMGNE